MDFFAALSARGCYAEGKCWNGLEQKARSFCVPGSAGHTSGLDLPISQFYVIEPDGIGGVSSVHIHLECDIQLC